MRESTLGWALCIAVLIPNVGTAQFLIRPTPYPQVTAAAALWQVRGDPVFHAGSFYDPAGPIVFFDGNVMNRTDTFEGVPIYEDATQTPFSVIYVPIGRNSVRPYERRREGDVAGTFASRPPSFPVQHDGIAEAPRPVGTRVITSSIPAVAPTRPVRRANTPSILQVWVPFDGARWYSAGTAVSYSADRFVQVGEYGGFPVYRDRNGSRDEIFIPSVTDGPVAPYKKSVGGIE